MLIKEQTCTGIVKFCALLMSVTVGWSSGSSNLPTVATPTLICVLTSLQILFDPVVVGSGVFLTREVEVRNPDLADLRIVVTYKVMFTKYGNHPDTPPFFTSCARLMKVVECREGARKYPPTTHFPVCDSG